MVEKLCLHHRHKKIKGILDLPISSMLGLLTMLRLYPFIKGNIILLLILMVISGCGGRVILSDDDVRIRKVTDFVHEIKDLYEQRNVNLLAMFSSEYLTSSEGLREAILKDMEGFENTSLSLFIDRIEMSDEHVNISIHWNGAWKGPEKTFREGG